MSSEQAEAPKVAEGAPEQSLPSRPAKQPKEKAAKAKKPGLEVGAPPFVARDLAVPTAPSLLRWRH